MSATVVFDKLYVFECRWFYANLSRVQAEDMLCRIPYEGAYLVRQRTDQHNVSDPSQFAISFRYERVSVNLLILMSMFCALYCDTSSGVFVSFM